MIIGIGKVLVGSVANVAVGTVVGNVIAATAHKVVRKAGKLVLVLGGAVVSNAILNQSDYGHMIEDGIVEVIDEITNKIEVRRELKRQKKQES